MAPSTAGPASFARAVHSLRSVHPRPEITLEEIRAPSRLAPYAHALSATVERDEDEIATGRLILLHDPAGHDAWSGTFRLVTYLTSTIEPEIAIDPLLPTVGWSWLIEALAAHEARYTAPSGTVTQTLSTRFGAIAAPTNADIEIRASWTPLNEHLAAHTAAWFALLATAVGLPPPGVAALPVRIGRGPG